MHSSINREASRANWARLRGDEIRQGSAMRESFRTESQRGQRFCAVSRYRRTVVAIFESNATKRVRAKRQFSASANQWRSL
jgi:hypothetical protein